jgi:hypothetical protein
MVNLYLAAFPLLTVYEPVCCSIDNLLSSRFDCRTILAVMVEPIYELINITNLIVYVLFIDNGPMTIEIIAL